jgi:agmatinase
MPPQSRPHYGPPDASRAPRYAGIRTFARCPASTDWENADVAVVGVPFDTATSFRPGPRFGPAALRDQSQLLRPWHPALRVDVFAALSVVDGGDVDVTPGNAERTAAQIDAALAPVLAAGEIGRAHV